MLHLRTLSLKIGATTQRQPQAQAIVPLDGHNDACHANLRAEERGVRAARFPCSALPARPDPAAVASLLGGGAEEPDRSKRALRKPVTKRTTVKTFVGRNLCTILGAFLLY